MDQRVTDALKSVRYRVATESDDLEKIYRLRYGGYRAEQLISANECGVLTDKFDETKNCVHVALEIEGNLLAAIRLHLVSELFPISPTLEVFSELQHCVEKGKTILDPTRLVIDPSARKRRVPLNFLALRIPFLSAMFYKVDLALASVRPEHTAFYRRYLGYEEKYGPRDYLGLKKHLQLLTVDFHKQRKTVLERTPVFGPLDAFPDANINFPSLTGVYAPSKKGGYEAA